jgi:hypothetical protein
VKLVDISGTKRKEYLKAKVNELETNSKNKNIRDLFRGISDFKRGYQPRTNVVKMRRVTGCRLPQYFGWVEESFLPGVEYTRGSM